MHVILSSPRILILLLLLLCNSGLYGSLSLHPRSNALGNADIFGYVRIARVLGDFPIGNGKKSPLVLVFTSDPRHEPGVLGPGWRFPLFDSMVMEYGQAKLFWEAPNEHRYFFKADDSVVVGRGERGYRHLSGRWDAVVRRNGEVMITGVKDSKWAFVYRNGKLVRFRLGPDSEVFKIDYHTQGYPLRIVSETGNREVFSVEYSGPSPRTLRVGDKSIEVKMGPGDMTMPNGRVEYGTGNRAFLRSLSSNEGENWEFSYRRSGERTREEIVRGELGTAPVNRLRVVPLNQLIQTVSGGSESMVEWESASGFVMSDSGGSYEVENVAYDPLRTPTKSFQDARSRISPGLVKIVRKDEDGKSRMWSYDRQSGVRMFTNGKGELVRQTLIMGNGPARMKLRKQEVMGEDGWVTTVQNFYDSRGRIVRSIEGDENILWLYKEVGAVLYQEKWVDSHLAESRKKGANILEIKRYDNHGNEYTVVFDGKGNMLKEVLYDGKIVEYKYNQLGNIEAVLVDGEIKSKVLYDNIKNSTINSIRIIKEIGFDSN